MTATIAVHEALLVLQGRAKPRTEHELQVGSARGTNPKDVQIDQPQAV